MRGPISTIRASLPSLVRALVILSFLFCATGCVYLRLLRLKGQLSAFVENFQVVNRPEPVLVFRNPVLGRGDVSWMMGLSPSETEADDRGETDRYLFRKVRAPGSTVKEEEDMLIYSRFQGDRLAEFAFPVGFSEFLTEEVFSEVFNPIRDAEQGAKSGAQWDFTQLKIPIPTPQDIRHYLGDPYSEETNSTHRVWIYRYRLEGKEPEEPEVDDVWIRHIFWNYNNKLAYSENHIGRLWITVDLRRRKSSVNVKREELTRVDSWGGLPF
ncbi:MAG: hypothetical protein KJ626_03555 [Verrucomicrobia bacterium]|nr:hypothetical protein [Verrucomicrobiota bacterium]